MTENSITASLDAKAGEHTQPEIDLTTLTSFKDSLYSYAYNVAYVEASRGILTHISPNDVDILRIFDDRDYKAPKGQRPKPPNIIKKYVMRVQPNLSAPGEWYRYNGTVWVNEPGNLAYEVVQMCLNGVYAAYAELASEGKLYPADEKKAKVLHKMLNDYRVRKENANPQKGSVEFVATYLTTHDDPFTEDKYLVLGDGLIIDLPKSAEEGALMFTTPSADLMIHERYQTNFKYIPNSVPGTALNHYLSTSPIDYETGVNMCRALACGLFSAQPKKFYSIIEMYGEANTGKSMFLEAVISNAFPGLTTPINGDHFGKNPDKFAMKDVQGKRVLVMAEYSDSFDSARIKQATGGDTLRADVKYKDAFTFKFNGVIAITSNSFKGANLPLHDPGICERLFPIPFPHKIIDGKYISEEGVTSVWDGPDLKEVALPAENDTTLSWMLDLWLEHERSGSFRIPLTSAQEREMANRVGDSDLFAEFLSDMQENAGWEYNLDAKGIDMVKATLVQAKYAAWLQDQGYRSKIAPETLSRLQDEGKVDKKSGCKRLLYWVEGSSHIRKNIVTDNTLTKGM